MFNSNTLGDRRETANYRVLSNLESS